MQYLHGVRMRRAEEYLRIGYYTATEVAAMCGFDDVGYFIKCFRRHAGRTPKTFATRPAPFAFTKKEKTDAFLGKSVFFYIFICFLRRIPLREETAVEGVCRNNRSHGEG